jgi:hypothetical protein
MEDDEEGGVEMRLRFSLASFVGAVDLLSFLAMAVRRRRTPTEPPAPWIFESSAPTSLPPATESGRPLRAQLGRRRRGAAPRAPLADLDGSRQRRHNSGSGFFTTARARPRARIPDVWNSPHLGCVRRPLKFRVRYRVRCWAC